MRTAGRNRQRDLDESSGFDTFCCTGDFCLSVLSNSSPGIGNRLSNASPIGGSVQGPNLEVKRVSNKEKDDFLFRDRNVGIYRGINVSFGASDAQPNAKCF